jgi:hypothetical protein
MVTSENSIIVVVIQAAEFSVQNSRRHKPEEAFCTVISVRYSNYPICFPSLLWTLQWIFDCFISKEFISWFIKWLPTIISVTGFPKTNFNCSINKLIFLLSKQALWNVKEISCFRRPSLSYFFRLFLPCLYILQLAQFRKWSCNDTWILSLTYESYSRIVCLITVTDYLSLFQ